MRIGIALGMLHPGVFEAVTMEADRRGFANVWLPEHLVFPTDMSGSPHPGEDTPPVPPSTPIFDVFAMLSFLAGRSEQVRLGTNVYLLGLRHPFVAARAILTLDAVSKGRADIGVGAGWLRTEWEATGIDPATRGQRLDEALAICRRLWTEPAVTHRGRFFEFEEVMFEPKPLQAPHPPLYIGGESDAALRRAARTGDGWIGMWHTPQTAAASLDRLQALRESEPLAPGIERERSFRNIVGATITKPEEIEAFERVGITDLIVRPFEGSRDAVEGVARFAEQCGTGEPNASPKNPTRSPRE